MAVSSKTHPRPIGHDAAMASKLTEIPNIGPAVARKLERLDVCGLDDLRGRDPEELFERLCALDGRRHDPCLLDTFVAAVAYADGGPARPWWEYSRERKARAHG
jgi:hypothetical protein